MICRELPHLTLQVLKICNYEVITFILSKTCSHFYHHKFNLE